jgi:hemolysin III
MNASSSGPDLAVKPLLRGVFHQWTFVVSIAAGVVLVITASSGRATVSACIYAVTISAMLGVSALYHRVSWPPAGEARMRRLDHSTIFLAIAGTYTPIALLVLHGTIEAIVLIAVWVGAIAGIIVEWLPFKPRRGYVTAVYVTLGWVAVIAMPQLVSSFSTAPMIGLVAGGVLYTGGALAYAFKRPDPWPQVFGYHEVWHCFVIAAAVAHYCVIAFAVLPRA